jgi:hypothetical protein
MTAEEQDRLRNLINSMTIDDFGISKNSVGFGMGLFISNYISKNLSKNKSTGI